MVIWTEWESVVGACETGLLEFRREEEGAEGRAEVGADSEDSSDMVDNSICAGRGLGIG